MNYPFIFLESSGELPMVAKPDEKNSILQKIDLNNSLSSAVRREERDYFSLPI
jgi:hypothetical protein